MVDSDIVESQYPDSDGSLLKMSDCDKITSRRENLHHVTIGNFTHAMVYGTGEHPRVESLQTLLLATF